MRKEERNEIYDVIIIGGGASGMTAGIFAGMKGKKVLIIEKNKSLGEKLKITGGGRCNVTNAELDTKALLSHYGDAEQFLYSPFSQFGVKETFDFFEKRGLPLVIQARKRAFPKTEKAIDVFNVLKKDLEKYKVSFRFGCVAKKIIHKKGKIEGILTNQGTFTANSYICATGGMSHPETGSTGDGFNWLKDLGHNVKTPSPTIVPIATKEEWSKVLSGLSLSFMKITFFLEGKKAFSKTGKILFTHFGISGPLILNSAKEVGDLLQAGKVTATIDAYPHTDLGALERNIINTFDKYKNKVLKNVLKEITPEGFSPGFRMLLPEEMLETKVHSITKEQRKIIVHLLKELPLTITQLMGFERAVVADGGVILSEIDMKTMRSKVISNLFVTGDLLNITRPSGGYSLQLCWTSGFVAGNNV